MAGKKDIVEQALKLVMGAGEKAAPKTAIRAYHVSPHDFDVFKPSEFRGSTFFSSTPERARRGAEAGRNEMVMETATELPPVNWRTYEVEIDPSRVKGLSLTPSESKWFEGLPGKIVGDDALAEATKGIPPGMYWDDFYDEAPVAEGVYEYIKKPTPPSISYEDAISKNRDIYRKQWPHYAGAATDEKSSASRLNEQGMGGYLVQDEGGLSFAINDPSVVKILRKYTDGGRIAKDNGGKVDPYAEEIASAKRLLEEKTYDDQSWSDWAGDVAGNAVRTARSILPTALGGEGEVGISDIARGAYEAGKDAVTFPGDVITGKQALFDEAGRPLESAVGRSFNTASTIGGASSVIPAPDNSLRVFGGIKSLTADKPAIRDAMKMEGKGASPDEIWDNTGWFRGADGRWRYEIPDIGTTVNSAALQLDLSKPTLQSVKAAKLGDYLQHPEFFAAYPQFKDMNVRTMPSTSSYGGMYFPRFAPGWGGVTDPRIELNENLLSSGASQRDVLLHEIQHAIQQKEGFAPGTNIQAQAAGRANPKFERYNIAIQSDPDMQKLLKIQNSAEYKAEKRETDAFFEYETKPKLLEINNSSLSEKEKIEAIDRVSAEYRAEKEKIAPLIKEVERLSSVVSAKNIPLRQPKEFFTPTEAYQHYAGETESRNVQNRRNMAREELRGSRPWETQDYPYIDQLFPENDVTWKLGYASGGEVNDDDIDDALRIAKDVGGSTPVLMEDAKGNKYDAQGKIIPPTNTGPNPQRGVDSPEAVGIRAAQDPATFDAIMERYAVPDRDIAEYEALKSTVAKQPQDVQQMTHVGDRPRRDVSVDMPLLGGEYKMGTAPYDVAGPMSGMAQTAYDWKTAPFYALPATAPFAMAADTAEGVATGDPLSASLAIGFGPGGKYAKAAGIGAVNYLMAPDEAEAGPERWFSKAMQVARELPMEKMTGQQALAMLRKSVSPEELKWTGVDRAFNTPDQITKKELVDYLEKNRVNTEDIILADRSQKYPYKSAEGWQNAITRAERAGDFDEAERLTLAWEEYEGLGGFESPRYRRHSTSGGEDYKETLITLPTNEYGRLFQSGHWEGYPNVIGHIRTQVLDVTPPGANRPYKAFNVDEAQSDYAKEGREIGFSSAEEISKREEEVRAVQKEREKYQADLRAESEKIAALEWEAEKQLGPFPSVSDRFARQQRIDEKRAMLNSNPDYMEAYSRHTELQQKNDELIREELRLSRNIKGVPSAPYVASTQNWTDLSVKKALDQAMDAGADYFTYTPGKAQAARYSLRNAVDELLYSPSESRLYGRKDGRWVFDQKVEPDKLSKYVGSSVADELLKQPTKTSKWYATPRHVLSGQQLELGGEGMIDYYDNIYKKRVEKVVKDATGKKVQWEVIPVQTADGPREQLGFRLTDDMKEARFSDFNKGGRVTDPIVNKALSLTAGM